MSFKERKFENILDCQTCPSYQLLVMRGLIALWALFFSFMISSYGQSFAPVDLRFNQGQSMFIENGFVALQFNITNPKFDLLLGSIISNGIAGNHGNDLVSNYLTKLHRNLWKKYLFFRYRNRSLESLWAFRRYD